MNRISHRDRDFKKALARLVAGIHRMPPEVMKKVETIFDQVARDGDRALFHWTEKLDGYKLTAKSARVSAKESAQALGNVPASDMSLIRLAAERIRAFHRKQIGKGFVFRDGAGTVIEERLIPLGRVGIYIPGGRHPLASTVLMTAIPARLAGVKELVMATPCPGGKVNPHVVAAAIGAGIDSIYKVGGAQAIASLATGTKTIPRVDKIVGPGSIWVAAAKITAVARGLCGIDSLAGPSEIVIAADDSAPPDSVALDLISQVEHGPDSIAVLVTPSRTLADKVESKIKHYRAQYPERPAGKDKSIASIISRDLEQTAEIVNELAPEHLEVMVKNPSAFTKKIHNAASIFVGNYSPVPAGDYMAGANHVLPTGGASRFSSPLGVYDFLKRQSVTCISKRALKSISEEVERFAEIEGLDAHADSIRQRFDN